MVQLWRALVLFSGSSTSSTWLDRLVVNPCLTIGALGDATNPAVDLTPTSRHDGRAEQRVLGAARIDAAAVALASSPGDQRAALGAVPGRGPVLTRRWPTIVGVSEPRSQPPRSGRASPAGRDEGLGMSSSHPTGPDHRRAGYAPGGEVDDVAGLLERLACGTATDDLLAQVAEGRGADRDAHQRDCRTARRALAEYAARWAPRARARRRRGPRPARPARPDAGRAARAHGAARAGPGRGGGRTVLRRRPTRVITVAGHVARATDGVRIALSGLGELTAAPVDAVRRGAGPTRPESAWARVGISGQSVVLESHRRRRLRPGPPRARRAPAGAGPRRRARRARPRGRRDRRGDRSTSSSAAGALRRSTRAPTAVAQLTAGRRESRGALASERGLAVSGAVAAHPRSRDRGPGAPNARGVS